MGLGLREFRRRNEEDIDKSKSTFLNFNQYLGIQSVDIEEK